MSPRYPVPFFPVGVNFSEDGELLNGIVQDFKNNTAYIVNSGRILSQSFLRVIDEQIVSVTRVVDVVTNQISFMLDKGLEQFERTYKTSVDSYNTVSEAVLTASVGLKEFLDEVFALNDPETFVYDHQNTPLDAGVVGIDMKLDWLNFLQTKMLPIGIADISFLAQFANVRWEKATDSAMSSIQARIEDKTNKFIFIPGVNSEMGKDITWQDVNNMAEVFRNIEPSKQVVMAHSAGTHALQKALNTESKADLYIFHSPRVSRSEFEAAIQAAGLRPDQVLVVTAEGDFPHWSSNSEVLEVAGDISLSGANAVYSDWLSNSYYDYDNSRSSSSDRLYNYVFIKSGVGVGFTTLWPSGVQVPTAAAHGVVYQGMLNGEKYVVEVNGNLRDQQDLGVLYAQFLGERNEN